MSFNAALPADNSKLRLSAAYIRNNFTALQAALGDNLTGFAAGTKLWFYQDSAPVGWSIVDNIGDSLISVKGGDLGYGSGGTLAGTWQTPYHTLTEVEMPRHSHGFRLASPNYPIQDARYPGYGAANPNVAGYTTTESTGGSLPHSHGDTWRPKAAVGIICIKD